MKKCCLAVITAAIVALSHGAYSQKTLIYENTNCSYETAMDLYNKEKFNAARHVFEKIIDNIRDNESSMKSEAQFRAAVCAYKLMNSDAAALFIRYIGEYPENLYVSLSWYYLGNLYYFEKNYKKSVKSFSESNIDVLSEDQLYEYYFKKGYSHFMLEEYSAARECFLNVKDVDNKYMRPATYYYSHVAYIEKQYEVALTGFKSLLQDESFGGIAPYYISQIYYLQGKYDELLEFTPSMLENSSVKRQAEMSRMVGDAYYSKRNFSEAIPYLEKYTEKSTEPISREDYYQLGFAYYSVANWNKAISNFSKVSSMNDSLNQNVSYHIADCYMKIGNKNFALNAFNDAMRLDFNKNISEDALFNSARLSYELDYHPYNGAVKSLQKYLNEYPNSLRAEEAKELLADLLVTTGNYKGAIEMIDQIKHKNERLRVAYQKVNYFHGIEIYNSTKYSEAITLFNKAIAYNYNRNIRAEALYLKGESYYRLNQYDSAAACYKLFIDAPTASQSKNYSRAWYNLGYAQMERKNYNGAKNSFKNFIAKSEKEPLNIKNDATLRLADCYYVTKDYATAIEFYDKSINLKSGNRDYAYLQKAICQGVKGNFSAKSNTLSALINSYPKSEYVDDAYFELGICYEITDKPNDAMLAYEQIIDNYPNSTYRTKALLKKGMIYRNIGQNDNALATYKKIIDEYKGTEEAKQAWMNMKSIYTEIDQIDSFVEYVKDHGSSVSQMEQDSMVYIAAENKYMDGDCQSAVAAFTKYIDNYPEGAFLINAQFNRAECLYGNKDYENALAGYEYVISQPFSTYSETSLLKSARINFNKKNYSEAIKRYSELEKVAQNKNILIEVRKNIMNAKYQNNEFEEAVLAAQRFMDLENISTEDKNEALAVIARSSYQLGDETKANMEFQKLIKLKSSELGAEANYYIAQIEFNKKNYEESEKAIFDLINQFASFEYWVAKSFILLSDVYVAKGDLFQAKYTLQSIIDNYKGDDLVNEAKSKYNSIVEMEKLEEQNNEGESEIIINE